MTNKDDNIFKKSKLISRKQPPKLERLWCKSEYIRADKIKVTKCGKNCICCNYIVECTEVRFKNRRAVSNKKWI